MLRWHSLVPRCSARAQHGCRNVSYQPFAPEDVHARSDRTAYAGKTKSKLLKAKIVAKKAALGLKANPAVIPSSVKQDIAGDRSLLRQILRECTYLPDAQARHWMSQHVLSRFRVAEYREHKLAVGVPGASRIEQNRLEAKRSALRLRRANEGDRRSLLKVLGMVYGRVGRRRHELMAPLLPSISPQARVESWSEDVDTTTGVAQTPDAALTDASNLEVHGPKSSRQTPKPATVHDTSSKADKLRQMPEQLRALLLSQIRSQPPTDTRPNPRKLEANIPQVNAFFRPMPKKRVNNMMYKHYSLLLDRLQVPLPPEEWCRLRDIARGKTPVPSVIPRRKGKEAKTTALDIVAQHGRIPARTFANRDSHALTPRYLRRLYTVIFAQCPTMHWQPDPGVWKVEWGHHALDRRDLTNMGELTGDTKKRTDMDAEFPG